MEKDPKTKSPGLIPLSSGYFCMALRLKRPSVNEALLYTDTVPVSDAFTHGPTGPGPRGPLKILKLGGARAKF